MALVRLTDSFRTMSRWCGRVKIPTHSGNARNPLCGDEIRVELSVKCRSINQIWLHCQGCMVSQACASMLCEGVEGKSVEEVLNATPEELMELEIRELTMNRQRCALIAYEALMNALGDNRSDNAGENARKNDSRSS